MAAPATVQLYDDLFDSTGAAVANANITATLNADFATSISTSVVVESNSVSTTTNAAGHWSLNLVPNTDLSPSGSTYIINTPFRTYAVTLGAIGSYRSTAAGTIVTTPPQITPTISILDSWLSPNVDLLNAAQAITGVKTFTTNPVLNAGALPESATASLVTDLAARALDSAVVHKTGAEAVAGVKTLSASPVVTSATGWTVDASGNIAAPSFTAGPPGGPYAALLPGDGITPTPSGVQAGKQYDFGGEVFNALNFGPAPNGTTDNTAMINAATLAAKNAGGKVVVVPYVTPGWVIKRRIPTSQSDGGIMLYPKVSLLGQNTKLILRDNCAFVTWLYPFGNVDNTTYYDLNPNTPQCFSTIDITLGMTAWTVNTSAGFTVGDEVMVKIGDDTTNPRGGNYETQLWYYAFVTAIPDGTHITLDTPASYTTTFAGTLAQNRSITKVIGVVENSFVDGFELVNDIPGSGDAEYGIYAAYVRNVRLDNLVGQDVGAGLVAAQFSVGLTGRNHYLRKGSQQDGNINKGRMYTFAEAYNVDFSGIEGRNFESEFADHEGYCRKVTYRNVRLVNNNALRNGATKTMFLATVGSDVSCEKLTVEGKGSVLGLSVGNNGTFRAKDVTINTTTDLAWPNLREVEGTLRIMNGNALAGFSFQDIRRYTKRIPLTPSMGALAYAMPSGLWRRVRAYASSVTGLTNVYFRNAAGAGQSSGGIAGALVAGALTDISPQSTGVASLGTTNFGFNTIGLGPRTLNITSDGTVPAGSYLIIEIEYWPGHVYPNNATQDLEQDDLTKGFLDEPFWPPASQVGGGYGTPAFPATTVVVANPNITAVVAYITAGANAVTCQVDAIAALFVIPAAGVGTVIIPAGSTFKATYAGGVPTWVWYGLGTD